MHVDRLRLVARGIQDLDLARLDDVEIDVEVANLKKDLPILEVLRLGAATCGQFMDLRLIQGRECNGKEILFTHSMEPGRYRRLLFPYSHSRAVPGLLGGLGSELAGFEIRKVLI